MALKPTGQALSLLVTTAVLLGLSWITVIARFHIRHKINSLGLDDWLMGAGLICFSAASVATIQGSYNGVGTRPEYLNDDYEKKGRMWFMYFQLFYVLSTVPIKASICVALLRITSTPLYRWILYVVMGLATIACLVTDITVLAWCRPVAATWDASLGTCADPSVITSVSYFLTIVSILTDWTCAILPAFILWDVQLKWRIKASLAVVLGLGVIASSATLIRIKYLLNYNTPENYLYGIAGIARWSIIESGVGLIAGSLATLRPLLARLFPFLNSSSRDAAASGRTGTTGGQARARQSYRMGTMRAGTNNNTFHQGTVTNTICQAAENEWERLSDTESQKDILHQKSRIVVTKDVTQVSNDRGRMSLNVEAIPRRS